MLELDGLPLPTIVYTLVAVAMATLFLCCWCKKETAGSKLKSASIKGSSKEKTETTQTPADEKSGNGSVAQCASPEPKPAAELGDFSAVQRETEILRSYRKAAPPKNRARQSRAPRAMNRSTENLDIFTELSEEELKASEENDDVTDSTTDHPDNGRTNDQVADQRESGADEVDAVKHRAQQVNGAAKRDTRSSMLADIEKTLASLHSEEETLDGNKVSVLVDDKEAITQAETSRSSLPTEQRETNSAQSSPATKGKVAPKVSPKPAPRKRGVGDKPQENNSHDQSTDSTVKTEAKTADNQTLAKAQLESTAPSDEPVQCGSSQATCAQVEISTDTAATTEGSKTEPTSTTQESCQLLQGAIIEHKVEEVRVIKTTEQSVSTPTEETNVQTTSIQATGEKEETDDQASTPKDDSQIVHTSETVLADSSTSLDADTRETVLADSSTSLDADTRETSSSEAASESAEDEQLEVPSGASEQQHSSVTSEHSEAPTDQSPEKKPEEISKELENTEKSEAVEDQSGKGKLSKIPVRAGIKSGPSSPQDK